jgi:hypothetical protein
MGASDARTELGDVIQETCDARRAWEKAPDGLRDPLAILHDVPLDALAQVQMLLAHQHHWRADGGVQRCAICGCHQ